MRYEDVALGNLEARLHSVFESRNDKTLYIAAARTLKYRDVVDVIDAAKGAGIHRVGIITEGMKRAAR